jgi:hypothetical protein
MASQKKNWIYFEGKEVKGMRGSYGGCAQADEIVPLPSGHGLKITAAV